MTRRCVGYSKAIISDVVQEKGTNKLARFCTMVASHCYVKEV